MHFISDVLEDYVSAHCEDEPQLLQQLTRETHLKVLQPRMLSGNLQGRLLSLLSRMKQPQTILEIGTYTGYSALCLAEGLAKEGVLHTIDVNEELRTLQQKYFDLSPLGSKIKAHIGEATRIIPTIDLTFDLVFIDADKPNYPNYFELVLPKMNKGGLLISDNVLWSGKVVESLEPGDKHTKALLTYNKMLKEDPRIFTVLLPVRDGLTLSYVL